MDRTEGSEYRRLYQGLCRWDARIPCGSLPPQQVSALLKQILMDHPELAHFEGKWEYRDGICPRYVLEPEQVRQMMAAAKECSSTLAGEDYPKRVYKWLLDAVAYDQLAPHSQNAYGALVEQKAVCKGIAKAYQLLMGLGKIPCILVEGTLDGMTKHVWNMIYINGNWLHVDVTMGYPCFRHLVGAQDEWGGYLLTTEEISRSHGIRNVQNLPKEERR